MFGTLFAQIFCGDLFHSGTPKQQTSIMKIIKVNKILTLVVFAVLFTASVLSVSAQKRVVVNNNAQKVKKRLVKQTVAVQPVAAVQETMSLDDMIRLTANEQRLPVRLWFSQVKQESSFKVRAVSYKGAAGLAQLMPATARRFGLRVDNQVDERFNPLKCLRVGALYMRWLLDTFRGSIPLALAGYNAGEGAVMKYGWRIPPFAETQNYVERILYFTYGRSGLSLAFRYNRNPQPVPVWNDNLATLPVNNQLVRNTVSISTTSKISQNLPTETKTEAETQTEDKKSPSVTRVVPASVIKPKLPTASIYFTGATNNPSAGNK